MGYSCTQDAHDTLAVIGKMYATDGNPNVLTIGTVQKKQYFFERGKEQPDGAITGSLMVMLPCNCILVGMSKEEIGDEPHTPGADVIAFLESLPDTDKQPAWV